MNTRQTPAQKEALRDKGPETEKKVKLWPEEQEYRIEYWHEMKKSPLPYDILATKGKESWIIDVKTGVKPGINISNVQKILNSKELKGYKKAGLALVSETHPWPYLFEYKKMTDAGHKAALTKKRRIAGRKAAETRRRKG